MTDGGVVLVVDDDLDAREMYCEYLPFPGFECLDAVDAQDALAQARHLQPSVVIVDAMMPGMDAGRRSGSSRRTR
jgi:CheY-like chemotaxis protein